MSCNKIIISNSPEETFSEGKKFAETLRRNSVTGFFGDLGTGKTQFIKGICDFFKVNETVNSPTFIIVNEYSGFSHLYNTGIKIFHFDFYRLKNLSELKSIGFENYISQDAISLIEWAEFADEYLSGRLNKIYFEHGKNENDRIIKFM